MKNMVISRIFTMFTLQCFLSVMLVSFATARIRRYAMVNTSSVKYTDILENYISTPRVQCVALCDKKGECSSVNHNSDTNRCELTAQIPRVLSPSSVMEPNWRVYYHDPFIRGIDAWQSSILNFGTSYPPYIADYAIDGDYTNVQVGGRLYCAHTNDSNPYWAMEFEHVAEVSNVTIHFLHNVNLNERNTNLRLLISATRSDSDNNDGDDCATYVGPPTSLDLPTTISCVPPVTGKFLKIIHNRTNYLTLCEVEVYSV